MLHNCAVEPKSETRECCGNRVVELSLPRSIGNRNNVRVQWTLQDGSQLNYDEGGDSHRAHYTVCKHFIYYRIIYIQVHAHFITFVPKRVALYSVHVENIDQTLILGIAEKTKHLIFVVLVQTQDHFWFSFVTTDQYIKFDPFCVHFSCSPWTYHAARTVEREQLQCRQNGSNLI